MIGIKGIAKKPITDATAVPYAVREGYVFYNNDGQQIGTYPSSRCINEKSLSVTKGTDASNINLDCNIYGLSNGRMATYYDDSRYIYLDTLSGCKLMNVLDYSGSTSKSNLKLVCSESVHIPIDSIIKIEVSNDGSINDYIIGGACLNLSNGTIEYLDSINGLIWMDAIALHISNNYITDIMIVTTYSYIKTNVSVSILYYNE